MKTSDEMKANCRYPDCGLCTQDGFCNDQKYIPKVEALEKEIESLRKECDNCYIRKERDKFKKLPNFREHIT